jgi:hypothetical protein
MLKDKIFQHFILIAYIFLSFFPCNTNNSQSDRVCEEPFYQTSTWIILDKLMAPKDSVNYV